MRARLAAACLALSLVTGTAWSQPDVQSLTARAQAGDVEAHHALGQAYLTGDGVSADIALARTHFEAGWAAGDVVSGLDLAELILFEFEAESQAALNILNPLTEDETYGAVASLILAEALFFGPPEISDETRALTLARSAVDRDPDLAAAYFLLGIGVYEGIGSDASALQAMALWSQGASGGDIPSMLALADSLRNGDAGSVDLIEARALYETAAALGDAGAADMIAGLDTEMSAADRAAASERSRAMLTEIGS